MDQHLQNLFWKNFVIFLAFVNILVIPKFIEWTFYNGEVFINKPDSLNEEEKCIKNLIIYFSINTCSCAGKIYLFCTKIYHIILNNDTTINHGSGDLDHCLVKSPKHKILAVYAFSARVKIKIIVVKNP